MGRTEASGEISAFGDLRPRKTAYGGRVSFPEVSAASLSRSRRGPQIKVGWIRARTPRRGIWLPKGQRLWHDGAVPRRIAALSTLLTALLGLTSTAPAAPPPKRALLLAPPTDASARLDAKALQSLALHLGAAAGRHYRLAQPCSGERCPPVDRLTLEVSADGPSCRLELLLIAPPLLPRRVTSISAACSAAALRKPLEEAMKRLWPKGGGEAESGATGKARRAPKGAATPNPKPSGGEEPAGLGPDDPDRRPRSSSAAPYAAAPKTPASQPKTPYVRDRAAIHLGFALLSRHTTLSTASKPQLIDNDTATSLLLAIAFYPAGGRSDAWADLGLELRYARSFSTFVTPSSSLTGKGESDLQWLEAGIRFRWNPRRVSGGPEFTGGVGWGYHSNLRLTDLDAHYLRFGTQGFWPLIRRRAWWLGLRAEANLLLYLPVVDVAKVAVGVDARVGLFFSYWGVSVRLEALLRALALDIPDATGGDSAPYGERDIGGLLSLGYAI